MSQPATDLSEVRRPIDRANGLPNEHYVDEGVFEEEKHALLTHQWAGLAVGADVPEPGDALPLTFLGMPLLLIRDKQGQIRVFQNTCRHRGMILVDAPRKIEGAIRCPYHSWCYSKEGRLVSTPHVGGPGQNSHPGIDRAQLGLIEVRSHVWRDVVFVNLSGSVFHERVTLRLGPTSSCDFGPVVVGPAGARGLMQIMPATARKVSEDIGVEYSKQRLTSDWRYNAQLGTAYLGGLIELFEGSYLLAFAGYNAGPHRAEKWIAEYGDPDVPEDWAFLKEISAYHTVIPGRNYPPIMLATTRLDDRVHPGHARKMAAKLQAMGYDATYYEADSGGHSYGKDSKEQATFTTLGINFLKRGINWES